MPKEQRATPVRGMKYISRFDYNRSHGYWVRVQRVVKRGEKPLVVSQFFADGLNGGRAGALEAAKVFRNAALETAPAVKQTRHQPPGVENGYGYTKIATIAGRLFAVAWYRDRRGKAHGTKYSVDKWTRSGALEKAESWLAKWTRRAAPKAA